MKTLFKTLPLVVLFLTMSSCSSIRVASDYDTRANFDQYKTFAFFKTGIDKAEINDLDKRRILRAIEHELITKGLTKSETPDLLISIFTKSQQRVDVYNNTWGIGGWGGFGPWGWGGFGPWGWGNNWNQPNVTTSVQGHLYIDLLDAEKKELVWQGMGTGHLPKNMTKKEQRIKEFVAKIMERFPPNAQQ